MKQRSKKVQHIARGFVKYLEKIGEVDKLGELSQIQQKQSWTQGITQTATITSAVKLNQAQKKEIESLLKEKFDFTSKIEYQVQPKILGGLVIRVGDKVLDVSLKHRLTTIRESIAYV